MKRQEVIEKLKGYAVFSALDVEKIIGKTRGYAYLYIQRLKKTGTIHKVENGRYSAYTDPFLVASRIVWPAYISGWAALKYHHLTEQLPSVIEVITSRSRKHRELEFMNVKIEFSRVKPDYFFGYDKVVYQGVTIFIAEKEKALLDALFLRHISPAEFIEIVKSHKKEVSIRKLKGYAKKINGLSSKIEKMVDL